MSEDKYANESGNIASEGRLLQIFPECKKKRRFGLIARDEGRTQEAGSSDSRWNCFLAASKTGIQEQICRPTPELLLFIFIFLRCIINVGQKNICVNYCDNSHNDSTTLLLVYVRYSLYDFGQSQKKD